MSLERALLNSLQSIGAVVRRRAVLPRRASFEQIRKILRTVYKVSRRGEHHFCTLFFHTFQLSIELLWLLLVRPTYLDAF